MESLLYRDAVGSVRRDRPAGSQAGRSRDGCIEDHDRRVALKVIQLGMDTRHVVARFEQERLGDCNSNLRETVEAEKHLPAGVASMRFDAKTPTSSLLWALRTLATHDERVGDTAKAENTRTEINAATEAAKPLGE